MPGGGRRGPFERRLRALGYPQAASFDAAEGKQVHALVVFLEDMKVRHLPLEDRKALRLFDAQWPARLAHVPSPISKQNASTHDLSPLSRGCAQIDGGGNG